MAHHTPSVSTISTSAAQQRGRHFFSAGQAGLAGAAALSNDYGHFHPHVGSPANMFYAAAAATATATPTASTATPPPSSAITAPTPVLPTPMHRFTQLYRHHLSPPAASSAFAFPPDGGEISAPHLSPLPLTTTHTAAAATVPLSYYGSTQDAYHPLYALSQSGVPQPMAPTIASPLSHHPALQQFQEPTTLPTPAKPAAAPSLAQRLWSRFKWQSLMCIALGVLVAGGIVYVHYRKLKDQVTSLSASLDTATAALGEERKATLVIRQKWEDERKRHTAQQEKQQRKQLRQHQLLQSERADAAAAAAAEAQKKEYDEQQRREQEKEAAAAERHHQQQQERSGYPPDSHEQVAQQLIDPWFFFSPEAAQAIPPHVRAAVEQYMSERQAVSAPPVAVQPPQQPSLLSPTTVGSRTGAVLASAESQLVAATPMSSSSSPIRGEIGGGSSSSSGGGLASNREDVRARMLIPEAAPLPAL